MESTVAWLAQYLLLLAIPGFVGLLLIELLWLRGRQAVVGYERRDTGASLAMGAGNVVIGGIVATATLLVWFAAYQHRLFDIPLGAWWAWVLLASSCETAPRRAASLSAVLPPAKEIEICLNKEKKTRLV